MPAMHALVHGTAGTTAGLATNSYEACDEEYKTVFRVDTPGRLQVLVP
jgi:hypothetical protein